MKDVRNRRWKQRNEVARERERKGRKEKQRMGDEHGRNEDIGNEGYAGDETEGGRKRQME